MAFHPFRHFRKHQKAYFAVLILLCMVTFVFTGFSSGGADPFYNILQWIGFSRSHGDPVVELYGKTIRTDDLDKTRMHRQLASEFLKFGIAGANPMDSVLTDIRKKIDRQRKGPAEPLPDPVQEAFGELEAVSRIPRDTPPPERSLQLQSHLQRVQRIYSSPDVQKNAEPRRAIDAILTMLAYDAWVLGPGWSPQESYFGGASKTEDLLDFLVWKHEADRLGIVLTSADVCREVNRAWGGDEFIKPEDKFDANKWVQQYLAANKVHKSLSARDLMQALTDEFRVAIAKEAIVGDGVGPRYYRTSVDGIHHSPAIATPDEFWQYFQKQRTTLAVSLLPISVEKFTDKVERQPTSADLRNLYARYKDDEPSPTRRQPAFKEPRRIKVQYFSYRPDGPFAKKLAGRATELLPVFQVGMPASTAPAGGGLAWAAAVAAPIDLDAALRTQYEEYRKEQSERTLKYDGKDSFFGNRFGQGFDLTDPRALEAQAPAAALGQLLGDIGTGGTPLATPVAWLATNELHERATVAAYVSTVLASASSSPFTAITLPTRYLHSAKPYEAVRSQMVERFEKTVAAKVMTKGVLDMRTELDKLLGSRSDKLDEFLKKAIADHGLENFHSMADAQSRQDMLDNPVPALAELRTAYEESTENPFAPRGAPRQRRPDFVDAMFYDFQQNPQEEQRKESLLKLDEEMLRMLRIDKSDLEPRPARSHRFRSSSGDVMWVFWRSEDKSAHSQHYEDIEKQVRDAWYTEQARKLARKEAERIESALKEQHASGDDAVKYLRDQKQGDVFELTNVAHLVPRDAVLMGRKFRPDEYRPYQPRKDQIAYPPADLVDRLLTLKKPGDALVLADQPVRHYYVAVLMTEPQTPNRREFYDIYSFPGSDNPLWMNMMNARRRAYYKKVMEQLRAEATQNLQGGEYVIPEGVRNRNESGNNDIGE